MPCNRVEFLGCPVDNLSIDAAIRTLEDYIRDGSPHQVAVINANKLWQMERDARLAAAVRGAPLCVPEKAVVMGSKLLGLEVRHHIGGIMLLKGFLPVAAERGYRLFFLGSRPEVLEVMLGKLKREHPDLLIVGSHHGYFDAAIESEVLKQIRDARPDALFVAMGSPRQELWISDNLMRVGVPVCMGVGGSFDVLAGIKRDAPDWVRALAMEWLFRLAQDPKNLWSRYLRTMPWLAKKVASEAIHEVFPFSGLKKVPGDNGRQN